MVSRRTTKDILKVLHGLLVLQLLVILWMLPNVYCYAENSALSTFRINGHPRRKVEYSLEVTGPRDCRPCFAA